MRMLQVRINDEIFEAIRCYCFHHKTTKVQTVIDALELLFKTKETPNVQPNQDISK